MDAFYGGGGDDFFLFSPAGFVLTSSGEEVPSSLEDRGVDFIMDFGDVNSNNDLIEVPQSAVIGSPLCYNVGGDVLIALALTGGGAHYISVVGMSQATIANDILIF